MLDTRPTELHPRQMAHLRRRDAIALRGSAFAMTTMLRRGRPAWANEKGTYLLVRWSGARLPVPSFEPNAERPAVIVGRCSATDPDILEFGGVMHAASTVYHYAPVAVSGGGILGPISPWTIQTRAFDSGGQLVGLMPNTPAGLGIWALPSKLPLIRWAYSAVIEQAPPETFKIYAAAGSAGWNFTLPEGSVAYVAGQTHYQWCPSVMGHAEGTEIHYTVRARTAAGVLSLIPTLGGGASPDYDDVDQGRSLKFIVPGSPPGPVTNLYAEVT